MKGKAYLAACPSSVAAVLVERSLESGLPLERLRRRRRGGRHRGLRRLGRADRAAARLRPRARADPDARPAHPLPRRPHRRTRASSGCRSSPGRSSTGRLRGRGDPDARALGRHGLLRRSRTAQARSSSSPATRSSRTRSAAANFDLVKRAGDGRLHGDAALAPAAPRPHRRVDDRPRVGGEPVRPRLARRRARGHRARDRARAAGDADRLEPGLRRQGQGLGAVRRRRPTRSSAAPPSRGEWHAEVGHLLLRRLRRHVHARGRSRGRGEARPDASPTRRSSSRPRPAPMSTRRSSRTSSGAGRSSTACSAAWPRAPTRARSRSP